MFLYFSNRLVNNLEEEEHSKIELWAEAYRNFFTAEPDADVSFELKVFEENKTIPVFYTDAKGQLLGYSNLVIPEDTIQFINKKVKELTASGNYFEIKITDELTQYLYYDESLLLRELQIYPYVQIFVIIVFTFLFYYMISSRKQYEQNQVWVGLSKETAHQLGTPIQSLMGWTDYLKNINFELNKEELEEIVKEIDKDTQRLNTIAERFSKIGSEPKLEPANVGEIMENVIEYMQKRVAKNISLSLELPKEPVIFPVCVPLFAWVIENLCKNSIDAIIGENGWIKLMLISNGEKTIIEIEDSGKGIPRNKFKTIFEAGYTTKSRGWGLGLTLVKRIVEQYHHGRIFVKNSTIGKGTTIRMEM